MLDLDGVTVRRQAAVLLDDIDWRVRAGERWVVLGANGAGKTTLLQVATGTIRPTSGRVTLLGEHVAEADLDELLPRVGWSSAALAEELPRDERVADVVLTATYAALRRGSEDYDRDDVARASSCSASSAAASLPVAASARCRKASASACSWRGR